MARHYRANALLVITGFSYDRLLSCWDSIITEHRRFQAARYPSSFSKSNSLAQKAKKKIAAMSSPHATAWPQSPRLVSSAQNLQYDNGPRSMMTEDIRCIQARTIRLILTSDFRPKSSRIRLVCTVPHGQTSQSVLKCNHDVTMRGGVGSSTGILLLLCTRPFRAHW